MRALSAVPTPARWTIRGEGEGTPVPDRRESEREAAARWNDPRIILAVIQLFVAIAGLAVVVLGGLLGAYVLMQTRAATSEMSNAQLAQQLTALAADQRTLGVKMDRITDAVSASTAESAEIKNTLTTLRRDLDRETEDRKGRDGWLEARIVSGK